MGITKEGMSAGGSEAQKARLDEELFAAAKVQDKNRIRALLSLGANSMSEDIAAPFGSRMAISTGRRASPLMVAARLGDAAAVRLMLESLPESIRSRPDEWRSIDGAGLLQEAVKSGSVSVCEALLDWGCDPKLADKSGMSAIEWARSGRREDIERLCESFLKKKAEGSLEERLVEAVRSFNVNKIKELLAQGADSTSMKGSWLSPLGVCVRLGQVEALEAMWEALPNEIKENPNRVLSEKGVNLLQEAVRTRNREAAKVLLKKGCDPDYAHASFRVSARQLAKDRKLTEFDSLFGRASSPFSARWQRDEKTLAIDKKVDITATNKNKVGALARLREWLWTRSSEASENPDLPQESKSAKAAMPERESAAATPKQEAWQRELGIDFVAAAKGVEECGLEEKGRRVAERSFALARELAPKGSLPAEGLEAMELKRLWEVNVPLLLQAVLVVPKEHRGSKAGEARRSPLEAVEQTLQSAIERMEGIREGILDRAGLRIESEMAVIESNNARWSRRVDLGAEAFEPGPSAGDESGGGPGLTNRSQSRMR